MPRIPVDTAEARAARIAEADARRAAREAQDAADLEIAATLPALPQLTHAFMAALPHHFDPALLIYWLRRAEYDSHKLGGMGSMSSRCDGTNRHTAEYLAQANRHRPEIDPAVALALLHTAGAHCDCEILALLRQVV